MYALHHINDNVWRLDSRKSPFRQLFERAEIIPQTILIQGEDTPITVSASRPRQDSNDKPRLVDRLRGLLEDGDCLLFARDRSIPERGTLLEPLG
jgi:hypothetical protein